MMSRVGGISDLSAGRCWAILAINAETWSQMTERKPRSLRGSGSQACMVFTAEARWPWWKLWQDRVAGDSELQYSCHAAGVPWNLHCPGDTSTVPN